MVVLQNDLNFHQASMICDTKSQMTIVTLTPVLLFLGLACLIAALMSVGDC